jgi:uncharacterized iron-regulated protein
MKMMKTFLILVILVTVGNPFTLRADSQYDILPLGPSKYKFIIDKIEKDQVIDTAAGKVVAVEDIINQNMGTDVFIIGEAHDNYQCHTFQRDFIETLYKKHPKIIVGFEFFWREDENVLEQWRHGRISEDDVIKRTGWYKRGGQNYGYTKLIMDIIQKNNIKTIGLNVPRSILRTVSRKGFDQLSKEEKKLFPTLHIPNPEHEYFIKSIFGTFAAQVPMWFTNIYNAQKCWDVIMAESMRQALAKKEFKGYKGVIIAGSNHVSYKLGIPFRYRKADKRAKITTIVPVLMYDGKITEPCRYFLKGHCRLCILCSATLKPPFPCNRFQLERDKREIDGDTGFQRQHCRRKRYQERRSNYRCRWCRCQHPRATATYYHPKGLG